MTKDVLISISGLQIEVREEGVDNEAIEIITPANYFWKNGKHYILYDEIAEGIAGVTKNKIKITGSDTLEIMKNGTINAHMIFEKSKKNLTYYQTPFGQLLIGIHTSQMKIDVTDENIDVKVDYELDINHEPLAGCQIRMNIKSKESGDFALL